VVDPTTTSLTLDRNGDGTVDETIAPTSSAPVAERGPQPVGALQVFAKLDNGNSCHYSNFGKLVGILFDEEIDPASSQASEETTAITHYAIENNQVADVVLQPRNRIVYLALGQGVGPYVERSATVSGILDRLGNPMLPISATVPIAISPDLAPGGTISGQVQRADGTPVPFAQLLLSQDCQYYTIFGLKSDPDITLVSAGANGAYEFDYVQVGRALTLETVDTETGQEGDVKSQLTYEGQHLDLNVILRGEGRLAGQVLDAVGDPVAGALVNVLSLASPGDQIVYLPDENGVPRLVQCRTGCYNDTTGEDGSFVIGGIPVGAITIEASHTERAAWGVAAGNISQAGATAVQDVTIFAAGEIPRGDLQGRVLRSDGVTPVAGLLVATGSGRQRHHRCRWLLQHPGPAGRPD
jgi:hypothetical protein